MVKSDISLDTIRKSFVCIMKGGGIMRNVLSVLLISLLISGLVGCAKKVARVDPTETIDLSGRWNDTDSRLVSEEMTGDCLNHPWIALYTTEHGATPVVIVGGIRNKSHEHIAIGTFIKDIERAFINSGKVQVVAGASERLEVRAEREEQQEWASEETMKRLREETGADYMMIGSIDSIVDQEGKQKVVYYQVNLELIDLETNVKVWIGQKKIKKLIERASARW